jgi:hypothetical protein
MRNMPETHREAVIEALGKGRSRPFGFDEVQEHIAKINFVLRR